ncbi:MAG TPA: diacylglycerol kinase family protein [Pyrinomonadaceae bacterium]|jgi:YegS/Rv2252/BmrU family lipid kinase
MDQRKAVLISNPNAGRGGSHRAAEIERFCDLLKAGHLQVELMNTEAAGNATRLAAEATANGATDIIVSGGDGTINEALQGLVGTNTRLAIWPRGTANVLASDLKLPIKLELVAEAIVRNKTRRIHIGCAIDEAGGVKRYFLLMAGIGIDATVARTVRTSLKRRIGKGAFWYAGIGFLLRWNPASFTMEVAGERFTVTFACIANAASYGGGLVLTPLAQIDKPEFEILLIDSYSRLRYLHLLSLVMRGRVGPGTAGARYLHATQARAMGDALVQVDGEIIGTTPMSFEIAPETIDVIVA